MLTKPLWPVLEYAVNYDYIVNTLCVNRDKPNSGCNGKCHLTDELAKQNDGQDNPYSNKSYEVLVLQIIEPIADFTFLNRPTFNENQILDFYSNLFASQYSAKILHPPEFN